MKQTSARPHVNCLQVIQYERVSAEIDWCELTDRNECMCTKLLEHSDRLKKFLQNVSYELTNRLI